MLQTRIIIIYSNNVIFRHTSWNGFFGLVSRMLCSAGGYRAFINLWLMWEDNWRHSIGYDWLCLYFKLLPLSPSLCLLFILSPSPHLHKYTPFFKARWNSFPGKSLSISSSSSGLHSGKGSPVMASIHMRHSISNWMSYISSSYTHNSKLKQSSRIRNNILYNAGFWICFWHLRDHLLFAAHLHLFLTFQPWTEPSANVSLLPALSVLLIALAANFYDVILPAPP